MVTILRPDQRIVYAGLSGVEVRHGKAGAAAANWWDSLSSAWGVYQFKGAASQAAAYNDLSGNGNTLGVGVAPTWNSTDGMIFNGSTQYLTTTFTPQNDQSQTMLVQFSNVTQSGTRMLCGSRTTGTSDRFYLSPYWTGVPADVLYGNGGFVDVAPSMASGNLAVAGNQGYRNGSSDGGAIGAFGAAPAFPVWIGCMNQSGSGVNFCAAYIQALAICDVAESAATIATVAAAMAAL